MYNDNSLAGVNVDEIFWKLLNCTSLADVGCTQCKIQQEISRYILKQEKILKIKNFETFVSSIL